MSQTETVLLFVLGFSAALLLVLLIGRGFFSILGRWSGWRHERKLPGAMRDLEAERDSLRAEKAVMAQRLETATSDIKMRMAEQMAEVARNRNRVLDLSAALEQANARIAVLQHESGEKLEQIAALKAQIEENVRAINEAWQKAAEHERLSLAARAEADTLKSTVTDRDARINNLENETKAMRDIVTMFVPSADDVRQARDTRRQDRNNGFGELPMPDASELPPLQAAHMDELRLPYPGNDEPAAMADTDDALSRSASNVLSLADRVRGLQRNMKRN